MNAEQFAAEQDQFDPLTHHAYAAGREAVEALIEQHPLAAVDGLIAYLCRAIAVEYGASPVQADRYGEGAAAAFNNARAESGSTLHAFVEAVITARLASKPTGGAQ